MRRACAAELRAPRRVSSGDFASHSAGQFPSLSEAAPPNKNTPCFIYYYLRGLRFFFAFVFRPQEAITINQMTGLWAIKQTVIRQSRT